MRGLLPAVRMRRGRVAGKEGRQEGEEGAKSTVFRLEEDLFS